MLRRKDGALQYSGGNKEDVLYICVHVTGTKEGDGAG